MIELPNEIIYNQQQNPITPEMIQHIPIILDRITKLLLRKGYTITPDPEGQYYMKLKKISNPSHDAGVIKLIKADGIISPSKILHRRYLNNEQYENINIPSLHTPWINIDPRDGGQGLGPLLLGYAILHLFMLNPTLYYLTLDDDSDHSGEFEKNIYIGLGFVYVDVSISNLLEAENIGHFIPLQKTRPTTDFFKPGNTQPSQPVDDDDYKIDDDDDDDDEDEDDDEGLVFKWEQTDSQMINTIPNFIHFLTAKIQKYERLQAEELERQKQKEQQKQENKNKTAHKAHKETKVINPPRRSTRIKKIAKGTMKKRKYGTKKRVKSFKKNVKSKLKRENPINLTRNKSSAYSYK